MLKKICLIIAALYAPVVFAETTVFHYCDTAVVKSDKACDALSKKALKSSGCKDLKSFSKDACYKVQNSHMWECRYTSSNCLIFKGAEPNCDAGYKAVHYDNGVHNLQAPEYRNICIKTASESTPLVEKTNGDDESVGKNLEK